MFRPAARILSVLLFGTLLALVPGVVGAGPTPAAPQGGRILSEHVWVKAPAEREWLGRDSVVELERAWRVLHRWTGEKLPRLLTVEIAWDSPESSVRPAAEAVTIGMGSPAARAAPRAFLMHAAAREIALYGLAELSRGSVLRDDLRAVGEGMAEILAREYGHSARSLAGAWTMAHMLDRISPLSLAALADWRAGSGGERDLRASAPAITLLLTAMELAGRERTLKLFEALRKEKLAEAIASALKQSPAALEETWLRKVRGHKTDEDVTVTAEDEAPAFRQVAYVRSVRAGSPLQVRLQVDDAGRDLSPRAVFVSDDASGRVLGGAPDKGAGAVRVDVPVEASRRPGEYTLRAVAIDDAGNVRTWSGAYAVVAPEGAR